MKQNLIENVLLVLIEKLQRIFGDPNLLSAREKLDQAQVDPVQVDSCFCEHLLRNVVGFLVDPGHLNNFTRAEVAQNHRARPYAQVLEEARLLSDMLGLLDKFTSKILIILLHFGNCMRKNAKLVEQALPSV